MNVWHECDPILKLQNRVCFGQLKLASLFVHVFRFVCWFVSHLNAPRTARIDRRRRAFNARKLRGLVCYCFDFCMSISRIIRISQLAARARY